jgi:RimJ/RimL family protein N-acetyltransferase
MIDQATPFRLAVNERIHLSDIRESDKPAFVRLLNDREIYDRTLRIPFPYSAADAGRYLVVVEAATAKHGHPTQFAIRDESEELIGCLGFDALVDGHRAEIGYWLAPPYRGGGIMTDVVRAACEFAVAKWELVRITAHVFGFNQASARVLEKNGFELEGTLRKHIKKDGRLIDAKLYALVK